MNSRHFLYVALVLAVVSAMALVAQQSSTPATQPTKHSAAQNQAAQPQNEGERIFQQNCARCHNAPEGFSPRISGTILRHMRVRASLSQHDEEQLLRFFNP
jgi:cytochrome c5